MHKSVSKELVVVHALHGPIKLSRFGEPVTANLGFLAVYLSWDSNKIKTSRAYVIAHRILNDFKMKEDSKLKCQIYFNINTSYFDLP